MSDLLNLAEAAFHKLDQTQLQPIEKQMMRLFQESIATGRKGNYSCAAAVLNSQNEIVSVGANRSFHPYPNSVAHAGTVAKWADKRV